MTVMDGLLVRRQPQRVWLAVACGVLAVVPSPVAGAAFPASTVLLLLAALVVGGDQGAAARVGEWIIPAAIVGVLGYCLSAFLNGVTIAQTSVYSFAAVAVFVYIGRRLLRDYASTAVFLAALAAGTTLFFVVLGTPDTRLGVDYLWKYGIAFPVTVIALWAASMRRTRTSVAVLVISAGVSLFANFRSEALICVAVAILVLVRGRDSRMTVGRLLLAIIAIVGGAVVLISAISAGLFGATVQAKTLSQADEGPGILMGRTEPPLSVTAVLQRPLLGWGNADAIPWSTISEAGDLANSLGMRPDVYVPLWVRDDGTVSLHSILLGSWAEAGVLGALLPVVLLVVFIRALWRRGAAGSLPLVAFVAVHGVWDILFSPWSYYRGALLAVSVLLVLWSARSTTGGEDGAALPAGTVGGHRG